MGGEKKADWGWCQQKADKVGVSVFVSRQVRALSKLGASSWTCDVLKRGRLQKRMFS